MERTEWLSLNSADARFLMLTAITHHTFSSPTWGEHEVRKLHAELAELDRLAAQAVADHNVARSGARRIIRPSRRTPHKPGLTWLVFKRRSIWRKLTRTISRRR